MNRFDATQPPVDGGSINLEFAELYAQILNWRGRYAVDSCKNLKLISIFNPLNKKWRSLTDDEILRTQESCRICDWLISDVLESQTIVNCGFVTVETKQEPNRYGVYLPIDNREGS